MKECMYVYIHCFTYLCMLNANLKFYKQPWK